MSRFLRHFQTHLDDQVLGLRVTGLSEGTYLEISQVGNLRKIGRYEESVSLSLEAIWHDLKVSKVCSKSFNFS